MSQYLANIMTGIRILGSVLLAFVPVFSVPFYALYLLCGLSDMLDGMIARRTNSASPFGARLDTAADLVFTAVALAKLLPHIPLPDWLLLWIAAIALIKAFNIGFGWIRYQKPVSVHSVLNKVTGGLLFLFPLMLELVEPKYSAAIVCALAAASAVQEGYLVGTGRALVTEPGRTEKRNYETKESL